jgi:APA family basic amino acid/polyamine antiporter
LAPKKQVTYELSRELSLFHLIMMGVGMMIGAGVFIGIGKNIPIVGPGGLIVTFALNTMLALCTAMSYAELSSAIPKAGGAYNYARIAFGRGTSFVSGWMEWFASSVAGSMYAIVFSEYTVGYFETLGLLSWIPADLFFHFERFIAALIIIFFIYINYRGASETGKLGALMTLGQCIFLLFIGLAGVYMIFNDPARLLNFSPFIASGWEKIFISMGFLYVAFEGYEVIAQAGDEAINPRQNLPKAMIYSVVIVGVIYVLVSFATVVAVRQGYQGVDSEPWIWIGNQKNGFGAAITRLFPWEALGSFLATLAVIFASTSALNATIYSATRASYALGRDRMLPGVFASISKKKRTPHAALLFTATVILFIVIFLPTQDVAASASIMFLFLFLIVNLCAIKIRLNMGNELRYGYLMPLFPVFPLLAIILQPILAFELRQISYISWITAGIWIGLGILIYLFYSRFRVTPTEDEILVLEEKEEVRASGSEYRIIIPIANPKNALSIVHTTIKLCSGREAQIKLLHMVPVPDQLSLYDAEKQSIEEHLLEGKEALVEAMLYLLPRFPITTTIRHCRNIARGIVSAAREKKTDLIIMGWHGKQRNHSHSMGSILDYVISRSPCNIVILKDCGTKNFKKIAVPLFMNQNDDFAIDVAGRLCEPAGTVSFLPIVSKNKTVTQKYISELQTKLQNKRIHIHKEILPHEILPSLKGLQDNDLLVSSIINQSYFSHLQKTPLHATIAHAWEKPLALVYKSKGFISWTKKWF